jgi:hypothetical protein
MELNIIDVIHKSEYFLKKVFPNGVNTNVQLGRVNLIFQNEIELYIYTNQKPSFSPEKWGKWGVDYTTIVLKISSNTLTNLQIHNWQNNKLEDCTIKVRKDSDNISLTFLGENWDVLIDLEGLTYQESTVYLDDALTD